MGSARTGWEGQRELLRLRDAELEPRGTPPLPGTAHRYRGALPGEGARGSRGAQGSGWGHRGLGGDTGVWVGAQPGAQPVLSPGRGGSAEPLSVSLLAAKCQGTEVKRSGSIAVPSSFGLPPHAHTPVLSPRPGWGCQRLFLLLSHPCTRTVSCGGHPAGSRGHTSAPWVCPMVGPSTCGAPGAAPTPRISQCGN